MEMIGRTDFRQTPFMQEASHFVLQGDVLELYKSDVHPEDATLVWKRLVGSPGKLPSWEVVQGLPRLAISQHKMFVLRQSWFLYPGNPRYYSDGSPRECEGCGNHSFSNETTSSLDVGVGGGGIEMEAKVLCSRCGLQVGYWAHGYYDPAYAEST